MLAFWLPCISAHTGEPVQEADEITKFYLNKYQLLEYKHSRNWDEVYQIRMKSRWNITAHFHWKAESVELKLKLDKIQNLLFLQTDLIVICSNVVGNPILCTERVGVDLNLNR